MAKLSIQCTLKNLKGYFLKGTFTEVTDEVRATYKESLIIGKKYLHPKHRKSMIFKDLRFEVKDYIRDSVIVFYDDLTKDLFVEVKGYPFSTIQIQHNSSMRPRSDKEKALSDKQFKRTLTAIENGYKYKGISSADRSIVETLKHFHPLDAFQHKWICDLDYAYYSNLFYLKLYKSGEMFILKGTDYGLRSSINTDFYKQNKASGQYFPNNKKIMDMLPNIVKRGDEIKRIVKCKNILVVEKITGVAWYVMMKND